MRISGIDFPAALLDAQQAGKLVVFAGAGVSVPAPSNYPNFDELADTLAGGVYTRLPDEPVDRFLGRLADHGVQVHELTRDLLSNPDSLPNELHFSLLQLFPAAEAVRLVTSNFDDHFTTAGREIFGGPIETYFAPALPLGHGLSGLAYLHGSVSKEPQRLVLTDSDFGRAYVTEGWATRFLGAMFLEYTVLFIGYSHRDPVVPYLARGLPSRQHGRRYALCTEKDADYWRYLGAEPLVYPKRDRPDVHGAVREGLAGWAEVTRLGSLDWEQRIRPTRPPSRATRLVASHLNLLPGFPETRPHLFQTPAQRSSRVAASRSSCACSTRWRWRTAALFSSTSAGSIGPPPISSSSSRARSCGPPATITPPPPAQSPIRSPYAPVDQFQSCPRLSTRRRGGRPLVPSRAAPPRSAGMPAGGPG